MSPNEISKRMNPSNNQTKSLQSDKMKVREKFVSQIVWRNVIIFVVLHLSAIYGGYLLWTSAKFTTVIFYFISVELSGFGITVGAHRLWAHKAFKAKFPLRVFLMLCNCHAFENSIWEWSRDHRVHHKYSETDADPHNAKRGFFFSHVGWLMLKKHPDVKEKGKGIDMSDLEADPVVAFQKKYYLFLMPLFAFILPTIIPVYFWSETWKNAFFVFAVTRWTHVLNITWFVNSVAHLFGNKPYDKSINPAESLFTNLFTRGEGFHNYHHTFPWDYKAAELPTFINWSTMYLNFFAYMGWVYDLRSASPEMVKQRVLRTGDGTHNVWGSEDENQISGDADIAVIGHPKKKLDEIQ